MEASENAAMKTEVATAIGDFMRQRRVALGMTQSELCRKLGKYQVWVSQRECGHLPVRRDDLPSLAGALQVDVAELQPLAGIQERPEEAKVAGGSAIHGVVTKEVITTEVITWQVGERSIPIEELNREDLLSAVRTLFEANGRLKARFEKEMDELAEAYEEKIHSLHLIAAAQIELEIREAVRDKMDVILEAVMAEVNLRAPLMVNEEKEETNDGH